MEPMRHFIFSSLVVGLISIFSQKLHSEVFVSATRPVFDVSIYNGNQLAGQASLYLQMHKDNPVHWQAWSPATLQHAQQEDKPIFLSIGYASCHWCHVMEHEVFADQEVAAYLNENFVSIKVDREERPDLDSVYMQAVQRLTGRGGWPLTVFLTPEGLPFHGGTYFPKEQFLRLLHGVHDAYVQQRSALNFDAQRLAHALTQEQTPNDGVRPIGESDLAQITARMLERVDYQYGGMLGRQKFPTAPRWRFLLHRYRKSGAQNLLAALKPTLDAMANGGLRDHLAGGFFRYSTEPTWTVPHFEKMLYDNAQLVSLYVEAGVALNDKAYLDVGVDAMDFLLREMQAPGGGFYASFDADSGGEEGAFYVFSFAEIKAIAGADAALLAALLDVDKEGNFADDRSVLTRRADLDALSQKFKRPRAELAAVFAKYRPALLAYRNQRVVPRLDHKLVTSWNGLAIAALAQTYAATGEARFLQAARDAAAFLWATHRSPDGRLLRASTHGHVAGRAVLDDYAFLAEGLLELFAVTQDMSWLNWALELIEQAEQDFARSGGGFQFAAKGSALALQTGEEAFDSVRPSGSSSLLHALLKAAALTGRRDLRARVDQALLRQADNMRRMADGMAWWFDAAQLRIGPSYELVLAGCSPSSKPLPQENKNDLRSVVVAQLFPHVVWIETAAAGASKNMLQRLPPLAGKTAIDNRCTAYVCEFGTCQAPTHSSEDLRKQLMRGWKL